MKLFLILLIICHSVNSMSPSLRRVKLKSLPEILVAKDSTNSDMTIKDQKYHRGLSHQGHIYRHMYGNVLHQLATRKPEVIIRQMPIVHYGTESANRVKREYFLEKDYLNLFGKGTGYKRGSGYSKGAGLNRGPGYNKGSSYNRLNLRGRESESSIEDNRDEIFQRKKKRSGYRRHRHPFYPRRRGRIGDSRPHGPIFNPTNGGSGGRG